MMHGCASVTLMHEWALQVSVNGPCTRLCVSHLCVEYRTRSRALRVAGNSTATEAGQSRFITEGTEEYSGGGERSGGGVVRRRGNVE